MLAEMAARLPYAYVPRFYESRSTATGGRRRCARSATACPTRIEPAVIDDLDAIPLPATPIVPYVECVQDRIAIEIMRGCPGKCRFCQSTTIKRPLRFRKVETIVQAALEQYRNTGYNEISLLSLSTSDYPHFDELLRRLQETFRPLGVSVSLPSLRINEQLRLVGDLMNTDRHSGLTLAPEAARDDMRRQIGKPITNDDLYAGCRRAFENGFSRVKLYFMCGLPGERETDLEGIIEMAETISRLGKEVRGRPVDGGGQRLELRAQAADALPVERHAAAGVFLPGPTSSCTGESDCGACNCGATTSKRACWKACCAAATAAWARRSSWPGAAAPASTAGRSISAAPLAAGLGRRRHRRGKNASPPLPCPGRPALGSHRHSARPRVFGARVRGGGEKGEGVKG